MKKICNPSLLSKNFFVLSNLLAKMSLNVSFFITSNKKWNWKALMPSIRSRPEDPKYGKKTYFGYSGRHQVHMNFQPSPPFPTCCNTCQGFYCSHGKNYMQHWIFLYYYLYYFIFKFLLYFWVSQWANYVVYHRETWGKTRKVMNREY